jgi:hypothetical protein
MGALGGCHPGHAYGSRVKLRQIRLLDADTTTSTSDRRWTSDNNFQRRQSERRRGGDLDSLVGFAHRVVAALDANIVSAERKAADSVR